MVESVAVCTTFWACVPIAEQTRRDQETAANRQRHECLVLSSQLRALRRRGSQAASTIRVRNVHACLQMFGGYGYMTEYPICKAFTDFRVESVFAGSNEIMKTIIAKRMGL